MQMDDKFIDHRYQQSGAPQKQTITVIMLPTDRRGIKRWCCLTPVCRIHQA